MSSPRLRFLFGAVPAIASVVIGEEVRFFSCSKKTDSNLPAPIKEVKAARRWADVLSIGTLTRKRLRESFSVGILGA